MRGEVEDELGPRGAHRARDRVGVAQVDLRHGGGVAQLLDAPRVGAGAEQQRHGVAAREQLPGERGADEAAGAGHEGARGHAASSSATAWRCSPASSGR